VSVSTVFDTAAAICQLYTAAAICLGRTHTSPAIVVIKVRSGTV
jgi:hypothetical protein